MAWNRYLILTVAVAAITAAGCHKGGGGVDTGVADSVPVAVGADEQAVLAHLTAVMRHSLIGATTMPLTFEQWVAQVHPADIPPPPPGTKYFINREYKISLTKQ